MKRNPRFDYHLGVVITKKCWENDYCITGLNDRPKANFLTTIKKGEKEEYNENTKGFVSDTWHKLSLSFLQHYIGIWEPKSDYCSVLQFEGIHKEQQSLNLNIELFSMEAQMWWQNVP